MKSIVSLFLALLLTASLASPAATQELLVATDNLAAQSESVALLDSPARLTLSDAPLDRALSALDEMSGVRVAFSPSLLPEKRVSCDCAEATVGDALDRILDGTDFRYSTLGERILIEVASDADDLRLRPTDLLRPEARPVRGLDGVADRRGLAAVTEEAVITGRVTEAGSGRPLSGVQVLIEDHGLGGLTDSEGRYEISGVPAGEVTVNAQMIGFAANRQTVSVESGGTATVDFVLLERALELDAVVVTGTPGSSRRREIGTSIESIDVAGQLEFAPVTGLGDLLQGRAAGVVSSGASGTLGTAGSLVLRGASSFSQGVDPVIYIDGVRVETGATQYTGGQATSRMADLDYRDVERIEVIRGAAATTLYGSEASAGVIQIFTKKGTEGGPSYEFSAQVGANRIPSSFPLMHPNPQYPSANDLIRTGTSQDYSASVRGRTEGVSYLVSGGYLDNVGSFPGNSQRRASLRVNLGLMPTDDLSIEFNTNFISGAATLTQNDNSTSGVLTTLFLGNPVTLGSERDPHGGAFIPVWYALDHQIEDANNRFIGSATVLHQLGDAVSQRLVLGVDMGEGTVTTFWPHEPEIGELGSRDVGRSTNLRANFDYGLTWSHRLSSTVRSDLSVGGQLATRQFNSISATGADFAGPGLTRLGATARRNVDEGELSYATGGVFVQEQLAFHDLFYLIAGLRVDGSSAFGDDVGLAAYPKVTASYVISEQDWFDVRGVDMLRLRTGYGLAGMQPGAFDAARTYAPFTAVDGQSAVAQDAVGNPDLAPEVSREWEGGLDASLFDGRLDVEATAYLQRTDDALLWRQNPVSQGFVAPQLVNIGQAKNRGLELSVGANVLERPGLNLRLSSQYAYNSSEVSSLEGLPFINIDRFGTRIVEGKPLPSKWEYVSVGEDSEGMPIQSDSMVYHGPGLPPHNGSFRGDLNWGSIGLFANAQWAAGHVISNLVRPYMLQRRTSTEYFETLDRSEEEAEILRQQALCCVGDFFEDGDWLKLREVGVSYRLPQGLALGGNATVYLTGRNLLTITGYSGSDPEVSSTFGADGTHGLSVSADFFTVPQARHVIFGMRYQF